MVNSVKIIMIDFYYCQVFNRIINLKKFVLMDTKGKEFVFFNIKIIGDDYEFNPVSNSKN